MKPSEVIDHALTDHLTGEDKWMQGDWHDDQGRSCMLGALELACTSENGEFYDAIKWDSFTATTEVVKSIVKEVNDGKFRTIADYNDEPGRRFDEVREVLEKARAQAQEMGR